ncbi:asparagine synthase (glutamine-hydrolyzing) [Micromonospora haikouensis]|uniref:asparagine synthase (glutamine-hydrolyzing) n=1 Tax=Micromonospora haikouensis TaxID=686309 RepID=UPI00210A284C|nr:asparagine synthase (glutamine-hydrolyzing) [Micromonospora haikouensis]
MLRHRGPDGTGCWVAPSGRAGLAQVRLAVVGVGNGDQPVRNGAGDVRAVVNGEFYDHRRWRRDLQARGHRLRTDSDSEIAVHLYEEDPAGFVGLLRGEFAVVLWDERRGRFLAVRDRFGVKPLYYTWIDGRLVVASEVKALFAAGAVPRWDAESFHDHLHACLAPDRTLFAGILQVPPGCLLRADGDGVRVVRYWDLDYPPAAAVAGPAGPDGAAAALVRGHVEEAVRLRLVADVPVGFHLSGGLDSSAVVGVAAEHGPVRTFTVRFPGSVLDEGEVAGRTAAHWGADHHEVRLDPARLAANFPAAARLGEMLQENGHGTARLAQSAAIRRAGLRVALAGEGGDELFLGYRHLHGDLALGAVADPEVRRRYAGVLAGASAPPTLRGALDRLGFLPGWLVDRHLTTTSAVRPLLHAGLRERFAGRDSIAGIIDAAWHQLDGRAPVHQSLYLFLRTWFCNYILAAERLDMSRSVEVRLPLLDHRLFEAVRSLPLVEFGRGRVKQVFRDAMAGYVTEEVRVGEKRPFFAPPDRRPARAAAGIRRWIDAGVLDGVELFDLVAVRALLDRLADDDGVASPTSDRLLRLVAGVCALRVRYDVVGQR